VALDPDAPQVIPGPLAAWPFVSRAFPWRSSIAGQAPQAGAIVAGTRDLDFRPMTAHIGVSVGMTTDFDWNNPVPPPAVAGTVGDLVVQVKGLLGGPQWYLRRFAVPIWRVVAFDISAYQDVEIDVLRCSIPNAQVNVVISNRPVNANIPEVLIYGEQYGAAATYLIPPGAQGFVSDVADAGFQWLTMTQTGTIVTIAAPVVANTAQLVQGTHFVTAVANWRASWRIST
jgi:hypothetical protein